MSVGMCGGLLVKFSHSESCFQITAQKFILIANAWPLAQTYY